MERTPAQLGWVKGPDPAPKALVIASTSPAKSQGAESGTHSAGKDTAVDARSAAASDSAEEAGSGQKGWMIQIGATDDAAKATALLDRARERNRSILAAAKPVTEKVRKGEDTFYRARFAGLDSASAETACRSLKRNGFSCFAARD